jgi:DNA-binding MarR family transcriptional regulator
MANKKFRLSKPASSRPPQEFSGREFSNAVIFFHEAVAAHLGMTVAEWKCLGLLEQRGPLPASRLAELSGFTTGAITGIVDRLERAGYARRAPHPTDRRSVIVQPRHVRELKEKVATIFESLGRAMGEITRRYNAAELVAIAKFFGETAEALRNETAKLKGRSKSAEVETTRRIRWRPRERKPSLS